MKDKITDTAIANLPPYQLRYSRRASRLQLKITATHGLEIIVPEGSAPPDIPRFLEKNRQWIEKNLQKIPHYTEEYPWPHQLALPAIDRTLSISYHWQEPPRFHKRKGWHWDYYGPKDKKKFQKHLKRHLKEISETYLTEKCMALAQQTGLIPQEIKWRCPRTRWGSCSANSIVMLNTQLLLLSAAEARSIMIHELCHLKHMNHSQKFWALVTQYQPDYFQHDQCIKNKSLSIQRLLF